MWLGCVEVERRGGQRGEEDGGRRVEEGTFVGALACTCYSGPRAPMYDRLAQTLARPCCTRKTQPLMSLHCLFPSHTTHASAWRRCAGRAAQRAQHRAELHSRGTPETITPRSQQTATAIYLSLARHVDIRQGFKLRVLLRAYLHAQHCSSYRSFCRPRRPSTQSQSSPALASRGYTVTRLV